MKQEGEPSSKSSKSKKKVAKTMDKTGVDDDEEDNRVVVDEDGPFIFDDGQAWGEDDDSSATGGSSSSSSGANVPSTPPMEKEEGVITLRNSQRSVAIDIDLVYRQLKLLMKILGREQYDVSLWLTTDNSIRSYNRMYRGQSKATDILSFPFFTYTSPEILTPESRRMSAMVQDLGDMMISIPYVLRQCQKDEKDFKKLGTTAWLGERGASGAMAKIFDVQVREREIAMMGNGVSGA